MILPVKIRDEMIPVVVLAVGAAIVLNTFARMPPSQQMVTGQIAVYVLTVVSFSVLFSVIPAGVILFGWFTGNPVRAALLGILLLPALLLLGIFLMSVTGRAGSYGTGTALFLLIPSAILGCAGYYAARKTRPGLAAAIILAGVWVFIVTRAFN